MQNNGEGKAEDEEERREGQRETDRAVPRDGTAGGGGSRRHSLVEGEEKSSTSSRNERGRQVFFIDFGPKSIPPQTMKIKSIYKE